MKDETMIHGRYEFSQKELDHMKSELPELLHRQYRLEDAKSRVTKRFKTKIDGIQENAIDLSSKIKSGFEWRLIACHLELDHVTRERVWIAVDGGHEVKREPFKPEDFQLKMADNVRAFRGKEGE